MQQALAEVEAIQAVDLAQRQVIADRGTPELGVMLTEIAGRLDAVYRRMTATGVCLDQIRCGKLVSQGDKILADLAGRLAEGELGNPDSDLAVSKWLSKRNHLGVAGVESWDDSDLKDLEHASGDAAIGILRRYRRLGSILSSGWLHGNLDGPDKRVHPVHLAFAQPTGRTTTLFPTVTSLPKELRPLVVPDPDN
jgi:hypothetical protein